MHKYRYIHTYTHTYLHTYRHAYIHTYMHTYIHTFIEVPLLGVVFEVETYLLVTVEPNVYVLGVLRVFSCMEPGILSMTEVTVYM